MSKADQVIDAMARAIQEFEGWYEGSRSYRNNNPGNLKFNNQAGAIGQDDQGHAIFDSFESGWNALRHQLSMAFNNTSHVYSTGDTLRSFFHKYAEGNSDEYAAYVGSALGADADTTLGDLIS